MKILLICVNYNSNEALSKYINSIIKAYDVVKDDLELKVLISDNSDVLLPFTSQSNNLNVYHFATGCNLGYLGAVSYAIKKADVVLSQWDYLIISNVDIELDESFFVELCNTAVQKNIGWVAPTIFSRYENNDKNPSVVKRYTIRQLNILRFMNKFRFLHYVYKRIFYKFRRKLKINNKYKDDAIIYAGHGSLMIFTNTFISNYDVIEYPCFLYSEEIFFAEEILKYGLRTIYKTNIKCFDDEHVSTSRMKRNDFYKAKFDSLSYVLDTYYR